MAYCSRGRELMAEREAARRNGEFRMQMGGIYADERTICGGTTEEIITDVKWKAHLDYCPHCYWTRKTDPMAQ